MYGYGCGDQHFVARWEMSHYNVTVLTDFCPQYINTLIQRDIYAKKQKRHLEQEMRQNIILQ